VPGCGKRFAAARWASIRMVNFERHFPPIALDRALALESRERAIERLVGEPDFGGDLFPRSVDLHD
jgi:hypothetical protein